MARTVLLADDSVTAQNMGRRILTDAGYEVITVNNGQAALKKVHENRPDLIVLDVYMPGYGGLEVCQRLKESGDTMRIPVLLTVGKMEPFKSDEAKRVRADGHIVKPFEASELLAALTKLEDRIVPAMDPRTRKGKSDKKARVWSAGEESAAQVPVEWTDRVEYLAQARQKTVTEEAEPAEQQPVAPPRAPTQAVPVEPAPEMLVVADSFTGGDKASGNVAAIAPAVPVPETQQASEAKPETQTSRPAAIPAKARWAAENVALSAEEASVELEREMQKSQGHPVPEPTPQAAESAPIATEPTHPAVSAEILEHGSREAGTATFAATASASSSPAQAAVSSVSVPPNEEETQPAGLDATAAWKNWEQIRDSVMAARNSTDIEAAISAITSAAASATESSAPVSSSASVEAETGGSPSTPSLQGEALANIVDSVLAELKPKLMEQIAKKLAAERK